MQLSNDTKRFEELTVNELIQRRDRMLNADSVDSDFVADSLTEQTCENPLGKLLQIISTLPEVRCEKVNHARDMIRQTEEELDCRMDLALDMVLEELITDY